MKIYIARVKWRRANLAQVDVEEHPKTYTTIRGTESNLLGYTYANRRYSKGDTSIFLSLRDAIAFLLPKIDETITELEDDIKHLKSDAAHLRDALELADK